MPEAIHPLKPILQSTGRSQSPLPAGWLALLVLGLFLARTAGPLHASEIPDDSSPESEFFIAGVDVPTKEQAERQHWLGRSVYKGVEKIANALVAMGARGSSLRLEKRSLFMDRSYRIFLHLQGQLVIPESSGFSRRRQKIFENLEGFHLATNGPFGIDIATPRANRDGDRITSLDVDISLVCIAPQVADIVTGAVAQVTTIGLSGYIDRIAGALTRYGQKDIALLEPFTRQIFERLQFVILDNENFNAARKYWQLKKVLGQLPVGTDPDSVPSPD